MLRVEELEEDVRDADPLQRTTERLRAEVEKVLVARARVEEQEPQRPWREDKGLMEFLRSL